MPVFSTPTDERGVAIDAGFYSTEGELFDRHSPSPGQLDYMGQHDSQVGALLLAIELILQSARFDIEAAPGDKGEAAFVRDVLFKGRLAGGMQTPMRQVVAQMSAAVLTKRVYFEKVWKIREDGKAVYDKLAWRPPNQCTMMVDTKTGAYNGFRQRAGRLEGDPLDEHFKPNKAYVYIFRNYKRPMEGYSAFQTAFGDYMDKLKITRLHNVHLEKFALGTVIGKYTGRLKGASTRFFRKLKDWVGGGGILVVGDAEEVKVESHTGAGAEFLAKISYLDSQMAGSVMLGFLLLSNPNNSGSWALHKDASNFFVKLMEAVLLDQAESLTHDVVADLVEANFGKDAAFPRWTFNDLSEDAIEYAAEVWKTLVVSAQKPQGPLWDGIEAKAAQRMKIDMAVVDKNNPDATPEAAEDPASAPSSGVTGLPSSGDPEAFRRSLEALTAPPAATRNGNGNGGRSTTKEA